MIPELYLAKRYLFRGQARHISFIGVVSCLGIALGVATLIVVISVMNGFDKELTDRFMRFNYHLTIESTNSDNLAKVAARVDRWAEVNNASIFLQTQIFAKFDNLIFPLTVKGIDFNNEKERNSFYQYVKRDSAEDGFFVGEGIARRFFLSDNIEFYPLKKNLRLQTEKIRGVFKVDLYDIDNNYIITDIEKAKSLSPNYLLFLGLRIKEPFVASEIKNKIVNEFSEKLFVTTWMESNKALYSALKLEKLTMFIILSLIILVAAFNIFATLTIKVVEKTKDIGVLKSLGFSSRRILVIFSLQGLLLGLVGTFLGTALGLGLSITLEKYPFIKLPEEIYYIEYLPIAINYQDIFLIIFVGISLSYIFSLFPAMRASKLAPSEALRYE